MHMIQCQKMGKQARIKGKPVDPISVYTRWEGFLFWGPKMFLWALCGRGRSVNLVFTF
jgi:hypothetical protein